MKMPFARYCRLHELYHSETATCSRCAAMAPAPDVTTLRLNVQSQTIDVLQSQIDLLSRRLARLHRENRERCAYLADRLATLEDAHNRVVVYAERNADRVADQVIALHKRTCSLELERDLGPDR
jgi:hypothetical protein